MACGQSGRGFRWQISGGSCGDTAAGGAFRGSEPGSHLYGIAHSLVDEDNPPDLPRPRGPDAMAKNLFTFPCPCCNKMIEINTRSGKARAVRADEKKGGTSLDDLVQAQRSDAERLGDMFSSAQDSEKRREDLLEEQLRRAKEEAKKDKGDKPRNIFDLD